ncbi:hypothetical protein B0H13DRAFT_2399655 [Mycena leptocephala]|nr:hypothetical protein B0H13DRAFT_2399655 [Mycena leptocephala]
MIIPTCCLLSFLLTSLTPRADDACPPGIGRVVTAGNAIYYHSFLVILFTQGDDSTLATVIYSPHSVRGADLAVLTSAGSGNISKSWAGYRVLHSTTDSNIPGVEYQKLVLI